MPLPLPPHSRIVESLYRRELTRSRLSIPKKPSTSALSAQLPTALAAAAGRGTSQGPPSERASGLSAGGFQPFSCLAATAGAL
jgi:hypothetical protein